MTPLHIALLLSFLSALLFALSHFTYVAGTFTTIGAAAVATFHFFTRDSLEGATA